MYIYMFIIRKIASMKFWVLKLILFLEQYPKMKKDPFCSLRTGC